MILVDSSVWIAHFRGEVSEAVRLLRAPETRNDILVGDIILLELLQGARDDAHASRIEGALRTFEIRSLLGDVQASRAAHRYRTLRAAGLTMSKTADLIIASYCVDHGHALLHQDRDFDRVAGTLGLRLAC